MSCSIFPLARACPFQTRIVIWEASRVSTSSSICATHQSAMIVPNDDKAPPPYSKKAPSIVSNASASRRATTLNGLPAHLLLQVIYWTCPDGIDGERRRMMLYWMCTSLRYVSRDLWIGGYLATPALLIVPLDVRGILAYFLYSFETSSDDAHPPFIVSTFIH